MQVEIIALCDAASDYQGRLCLLGAFDVINAINFPATHPHCAIALRLRFARIENGNHTVRLHFVDDDGNLILPPLDGEIAVACAESVDSASTNLILGVQGLQLPRPGDYAINLAVDGRQAASIPLFVRAVTSHPSA
ncbi:MAG: hypothetical protein ABI679_14825 [Gemmatimonadota bacterium]